MIKSLANLLPLATLALVAIVPGARAADAPITLRAARILDGRGGVIPSGRITVVGSRITKVEANATGSATYDLGTATILPGLIDAHAHVVWYFNSKFFASACTRIKSSLRSKTVFTIS